MKFCYKCKSEKNLNEFSLDKSRSDGYSNKCKGCRNSIKSKTRIEFVYVENKFCTKCRTTKPRDQFRVDRRQPDGLHQHCTQCRKITESRWRDSNRQHLREKSKDQTHHNKIVCRSYVFEYLKSNHCIDCDEDNILLLDFDHLEPSDKKYSIGKMLNSRGGVSLVKLKAEIDKCVVRCANCHRLRTIKQFGSWKTKLLEQELEANNSSGSVSN